MHLKHCHAVLYHLCPTGYQDGITGRSLLLTYHILVNSCQCSYIKSMSEVFLFSHFPYAGRRPNLGAESQYGLSSPGFLTDFGIYFRMDSGPADLVTLWIAACLQVHVWLLQAGNLVKAEWTISVQGSSSCFPWFPQGWHRSCCGHPPVQGFNYLSSPAALL